MGVRVIEAEFKKESLIKEVEKLKKEAQAQANVSHEEVRINYRLKVETPSGKVVQYYAVDNEQPKKLIDFNAYGTVVAIPDLEVFQEFDEETLEEKTTVEDYVVDEHADCEIPEDNHCSNEILEVEQLELNKNVLEEENKELKLEIESLKKENEELKQSVDPLILNYIDKAKKIFNDLNTINDKAKNLR